MKHKQSTEYRLRAPERSSYGYYSNEGNSSLWGALAIVTTVGFVLFWWAHEIYKW